MADTPSKSSASIMKDFVVLDPHKVASMEAADDTLYQRINEKYDGFHQCELISCHEFGSDWSSWEIHPHGDEIVILLSGEVTFILEKPDGVESVALADAGEYTIVPKNTWHTARTDTRTRMLFITPGEGTRHRDI